MRRPSRLTKTVSIVASVVLLLGACGDEPDSGSSEPVDPPDTPERALPVAGGPDDDEFEEPPEPEPFVPEDRVSEGSEDECCPTTFVYAPDRPAQVASAVLRGSLYPLNSQDGLTLEESEGIWSGEACLTPDEYGTYHYDVELRTGGEETFPTVAHNPYAPTTTSAVGDIVNEWQPADDCASLDVSVHAKTSD